MSIGVLPDDIDELKQLVLKYYRNNEILKEEVILLRRLRFAHKPEKWTKEDEKQASLFDEAELVIAEAVNTNESKEFLVKSHSRKQKNTKALNDSLIRKEIIHDLKEEEKVCSCGHCEGLSDESKPAVGSPKREESYEGGAFLPESYATP